MPDWLHIEFDHDAYEEGDGHAVSLYLGVWVRVDMVPAQLPALINALAMRVSVGTLLDGEPESLWAFAEHVDGCLVTGRDLETLEYGFTCRIPSSDIDATVLALQEFAQCLPI